MTDISPPTLKGAVVVNRISAVLFLVVRIVKPSWVCSKEPPYASLRNGKNVILIISRVGLSSWVSILSIVIEEGFIFIFKCFLFSLSSSYFTIGFGSSILYI